MRLSQRRNSTNCSQENKYNRSRDSELFQRRVPLAREELYLEVRGIPLVG